MGIYGALSSAVTGLRAQSHALENISGNIANSQTTGYKRIETDFLDLIPDAPIKRQVPGAVLAQSRGTNDIQGDIKTVSNETFIALNSNGFFVVEPKIGQSDGNSVFAGTNFYTRRGDFEIDKDGLLVNGAGYYLKGLDIDSKTGNISGSVPGVIKLSNAFLPAQRTSTINYQANLPQLPKNSGYSATGYNSELLLADDYVTGSTTAKIVGNVPLVGTDDAASAMAAGSSIQVKLNGTTVTFDFFNSANGQYGGGNIGIDVNDTDLPHKTIDDALTDMQAQIRSSGGPAAKTANIALSGGNLQIDLGDDKNGNFEVTGTTATMDALGLTNGAYTAASQATVGSISAEKDGIFKADSVAGGAITVYAANGAPANVQLRWAKVDSYAAGGVDKWNLYYMSDSNATGTSPMWSKVPGDFAFDESGSFSPAVTSTTVSNLTINGVNLGEVKLTYDINGLSQFADINGTASVSTLNQNGYGAGEFVSVAINDSGRVVATYSNGERIDIAQVVTAQFNAINQLKRLDGGVFQSTSESGEAILDLSGSGILGGALEASNTDISDEFTKLIVTQQAYAASTRIVTAADKMLQDALNMIR